MSVIYDTVLISLKNEIRVHLFYGFQQSNVCIVKEVATKLINGMIIENQKSVKPMKKISKKSTYIIFSLFDNILVWFRIHAWFLG